METFNCDLLCVGGGLSGVELAVTKAGEGKKVIIVERNEFLGGSAVSSCSVKFPSRSEFADRFISLMESRKAILRADTAFYSVNAEIVKLVCLQLCLEANVKVFFHTTVSEVKAVEDKIDSCIVFGKGTYFTIRGQQYADTTNIGELAFTAGLKCHEINQNWCDYTFSICNYEDKWVKMNSKLPCGAHFLPSAEKSRLLVSLDKTQIENLDGKSLCGISYSFSLKALEILEYLRKNLKGFEDCRISSVPPMLNLKSKRGFENNYTNLSFYSEGSKLIEKQV